MNNYKGALPPPTSTNRGAQAHLATQVLCHCIEAAKKRGVDRPLKPELKYFQLKYCCVHGGQKFKP